MKKLITFAILVLSIQQASAACKQADAKGTWIAYQSAFVTPFGDKERTSCPDNGSHTSGNHCTISDFNGS